MQQTNNAQNCNGLFAVHTSEKYVLNYVQSFIQNIPSGFSSGIIEKIISKTPHERQIRKARRFYRLTFFLKLS
jgi:hypothetical protein